jgi:hypothetical protein
MLILVKVTVKITKRLINAEIEQANNLYRSGRSALIQ